VPPVVVTMVVEGLQPKQLRVGNAVAHQLVCTVAMASHPASPPQDTVWRALSGWGTFLAAAIRSPREVGTLLPSGPELARRLAAVVPRVSPSGRPAVVVEVGAGAGAVTGAIAEQADQDAVVIAIEKDAGLAEGLRSRQLGVQVVTADAATLPAILAAHGVDRADVIVSVLPWTLFGPQQQRELLAVFAAALHTDGVFTAAAYSLGYWTSAARRFRYELEQTFGEVLPTRTMWHHLPPAMTYVCRRPGGVV
jgi:phosphatidylethanolamine/phosphatidyl-N-methylethanolamine N-methyltransferase